MTNKLATLDMNQWAVMREQADVLVQSGFLPKAVTTPEAAIAIMQTGREFGLEPMESFRHIHIINGSPTLAAGFMAGMVQQYCEKRGGYLRQVDLTDDHCTIEYMRATWPEPQRFTFSIADAKKAGLAEKDVWKKNPRQMLYNRAVANACRMGWPEIVSGVYDPEELDSLQPPEQDEQVIVYRAPVSSYVPDDEPTIDITEAEYQVDSDGVIVEHDDTPPEAIQAQERLKQKIQDEYLARILAAKSTAALVSVGEEMAANGVGTDDLRTHYATRLKELTGSTKQRQLAGVGAAAGEAGADKFTS